MARWVKVAETNAVETDAVIGVRIEGREIAVYNIAGTYRATDNVCTHAFALLSDGFLDEGVIECPIHAGRFDVATGCALGPPVSRNIKAYAVKVEGTEILADFE